MGRIVLIYVKCNTGHLKLKVWMMIYIDFDAGPSSVPTWIQICTKYLNNRNPLINIIEKHVEKKT